MPGRWRKHVEVVACGLVISSLAGLAIAHEGIPAVDLELNDGGVWVTNASLGLVGHLNYDAQTLDGGLRALTPNADVSQFGTHVLVSSTDLLQPLDTAAVALTGEASTVGLTAVHGGDLVLFADPNAGEVWARTTAEAGGFSPTAEPTLEELDHPRIAVGTDGTGFIVTADGVVRTIVGAGQTAAIEEHGKFSGPLGEDATLTVVGDTLVALDGQILKTTRREVDLGSEGVLQHPSGASSVALVATTDALLRIPLGSGDPQVTDVPTGRPSAPVWLEGCAYGLWAESGYYVRDCGDPDTIEAARFPELAAAAKPAFRVNRSAIVINDLSAGTLFLPRQAMQRVDNWDLVANQVSEEEQEQQEEDSDETEESKLQEFSEEQHPPVAQDDKLGARPGAATTLPILLNDFDADGDVLTAVLGDVPGDVTVTLAKDGRAARIEVPADKTGSVSFTYQATDGVDLSNTATVNVAIRQTETNEPPVRQRKNTLSMAERATVDYAALADWSDPDGDPIFLANAVGGDGVAVTWRPDGFVSVRDLGTGGPGRRTVAITVSDGAVTTTEELTVQVTPGSSNGAPVANNDHYTAAIGQAVTLTPLANDTDPENAELRLVEISATAPEVTIQRDPTANTLQFTATQVGTQTIVYSISDGPNTSKGKIRVDVTDPEQADPRPAAENDLALLPPNGSVIVEPLTNDYDPAGGVLIIQGVSMGSSKGLNVEVVRHSLLRVTAPAGLEEPQTFEYTISNGFESATAKVLVVPLAVQSTIQPPVALKDTTVVRAGDIVTVHALDNDYSPSDLAISLLPELDVRSSADLGEFFVSGETVRFRAGTEPGTAEAIYTVQDSESNVASSTVEITVMGIDSNSQPVPASVEARTFAGMSVRIPIPLDGVDPDGDSVELAGASGARLGSVTHDGSHLTYEAGKTASGTDTFSYTVRDRFGAEATGTVRVGVAPTPSQNQAPVAVPDEIAARPGTRLEIPATANDVDPDGDKILIVADSVEPITQGWDPEAEIDGQLVAVTTPATEGVYQLYYSITDGGGAPVVGIITVTVDENVPPRAPVAQDDHVPADSIAGLDEVEVDVLANDSDPDGTAAELTVEVDAPGIIAEGKVVVPLAADRQIVLYSVTDADGLTARAAIVVPGKDQVPPYLDPARIPAVVKGGDTLTIDLDEYVIMRADHSAKLTAVSSVVAGQGGNTKDPDLGLKVVDDTTITFTPDVLFFGTTSLSFEVHDGNSLEDPLGLRATLSVPITVETSGLFPPELRPSEVKVAPGEKPIDVSLAAMVDDPDEGDNEKMAFSVVSVSQPFEVNVAGQQASVAVPADAKPGTMGSAVISVHDGSTEPLEMTVPLTVITSTRPLMTISDITDTDGRVGTPITFDLSQYIVNPFADVGGEVTLVGSPQVTGPANASANGLRVTVTPTDSGASSDSAEQVVVTYTAADATLDSSRHRTGVIRITVKDTPKAPVNVSAEYVKSRTARVSWSHSGWRGGQPAGFTVSWSGGSKDCGLKTSCDIDTLANNNTYSFTVRARVAEGDISNSPESAASNAIFVDVAPNPPAAPVGAFGDQQAALTWPVATVPDGGSPVTRYTVEITPADQQGRTQLETSATQLTWTGLKNGTSYVFRLRAHNKQTDVDNRVAPPAGPNSAPVIPAGAPSQQGAPTVAKDKAAAGVTPRATVTWAAPGNPNGDTSFSYEVRMTGGEVVYTGSANSTVVTMNPSTEDRTFEVRSTNKSKLWSEWSPVSNKVRAFQPPGAPTGFSLRPTGASNTVTFTFTGAPGNGARPEEIRYRWTAGNTSGMVTSGQSVTHAAFVNGSTVSVRLTAISTVAGETAEGGSATASVNAYAPPAAPSVSSSGGVNTVTQNWSMPGSSNGRSISAVELSPGGTVALSGSRSQGNGRDQRHCFKARAQNSEGLWGPWSGESCASTWRWPWAYSVHGAYYGACRWNTSLSCNYYEVSLHAYNPNSQVHCTVSTEEGVFSGSFLVDSNGNREWGRLYHATRGVLIQGVGWPSENLTGDCKQG